MDDYDFREMAEKNEMAMDALNDELSRLRDLVKEMRDTMAAIVYWADQGNIHASWFDAARSDIAKADAILKESGHE